MASRRWFQVRLATMFVIVTIVACGLALGPRIRASLNVRSISNSDVKVDGNFLGLAASIDTRAAKALRQQGKSANHALFAALRDKDRFAAAHVLLTDINDKHRVISAAEWNGMRITLHADGRVDFHPEQMPRLEAQWSERLDAARR